MTENNLKIRLKQGLNILHYCAIGLLEFYFVHEAKGVYAIAERIYFSRLCDLERLTKTYKVIVKHDDSFTGQL